MDDLNNNFEANVLALRREIKKELGRCTKANSPILFEMLRTPVGYEKLEELVIVRVLQTTLSPSAVIPQLEQEFSMND